MKRKYPTELIIKRAKWQVVFTNTMDFEGYETFGLCDPKVRTIFIKKGMTERQTLSTFIHEVAHAFEVEYDIDLGHKLINKMELPLADFIRFNFS